MSYSEKADQFAYLTKVLVGVLIVCTAVVIALVSPHFQLSGSLQLVLMIFLAGFFALIFPLSYMIYSKMDELQKKLHEHACIAALTLTISLAGIIGVFQANGIIPLFNQFWFLGFGIAVWAVALAFSDRFYK